MRDKKYKLITYKERKIVYITRYLYSNNMLFRDKDMNLIEIRKMDFSNDKNYYLKLIEINNKKGYIKNLPDKEINIVDKLQKLIK